MIFICSDQDFLSTDEIGLLRGDSTRIPLNEAAVLALGLEEPIGQTIEIPRVNWSGDLNPLEEPFRAQVAGVVRNFHFEDFGHAIKPMVIAYWRNPIQDIDYCSLRIRTSDWGNSIAALGRINDGFDPENPLEYHILNDEFQRFYEAAFYAVVCCSSSRSWSSLSLAWVCRP